jgi:hypothetical protein
LPMPFILTKAWLARALMAGAVPVAVYMGQSARLDQRSIAAHWLACCAKNPRIAPDAT